jgi:hypothetical protein
MSGASCGIDPGRGKFGLAVADALTGESLLFSAILPASEAELAADCLLDGEFERVSRWRTDCGHDVFFHVGGIFIGNGTGFDFFRKILDGKSVVYNIINEYLTTLEGRTLYWKIHPPRGLWRIVPRSLLTPPRSVDDMAAWAIIRRGIGA